ncbi:phospholipid phosphatase 3-like isoform X2 [Ovis aries]|uniref:phospholipid phosphatase 3-like isoform X2 n=1 Tax=Ovis aries TaxID=9940 RepID=UPI001C2E17F9|nr:phospholipid phosphatase 3-like isoform X2 [Ovis aries]
MEMERSHLPNQALSRRMTTRESPKVCNRQHGDVSPRRTLFNSDMTLTRGTLRKAINLPYTILALPELVVRYQCLWPGDPRRTPLFHPLPHFWTAKLLVALDLFCLMLVSLPIVLSETGLLEPHIQGFFCNDTTIQYPRMAHYIIEDSALMKMSFFISIFTLYIQAGSWGQKIWLLRPTIQLLFLSLALLTGYIRVLDHWHHPCDAFFGFFQGALMAFWVVFYISGNAKSQDHLCSVCHVPPHFPSLYSSPADPQGTRGMP